MNLMAQQNIPWVAGVLVVLCAVLWLLQGLLPPGKPWISEKTTRLSPMDMPDWYRIPIERGERYIELAPAGVLSEKGVNKKRAAIRGY